MPVPAASGTTMVTGRPGQDSASAAAAEMTATTSIATAMSDLLRPIPVPPPKICIFLSGRAENIQYCPLAPGQPSPRTRETSMAAANPSADTPSIISMRGIVKTFGGTRAVDHVDFDIREGEVHALLGGNGAGKSTLIKVLAGVHTPDAGRILLADRAV